MKSVTKTPRHHAKPVIAHKKPHRALSTTAESTVATTPADSPAKVEKSQPAKPKLTKKQKYVAEYTPKTSTETAKQVPFQTNYQTKPKFKKGGYNTKYSRPADLKKVTFAEGRLDGRILMFNKGIGFVQDSATKAAVFFHISEYNVGGYKKIIPGSYVSFEVGTHNDKIVAKNLLPKVQAMVANVEVPLSSPSNASVEQV